ncbi:PREDICTED: LOC109948402 isoform, partial [Prunus dulcis]
MALLRPPKENTPPHHDLVELPPPMVESSLYSILSNYEDREYFNSLAALHFVVHEENAHIPRILQWRSSTSARFHELMSQVFENREVDVQLLRPSVSDKHADNSEEIVELFGDDAKEKTNTFVEQKDDEFDETATLSSSSKDKVSSTELPTLKGDFQRTKNELAK